MTPPYICVGCVFFNDADSIERMLDSCFLQLPMRMTKILMLDGRFIGYQDKSKLSNDGSRYIIKAYIEKYGEDKIELYDIPDLLERYKRQCYLNIAAELGAHFILILDSDEYIEVKDRIGLLSELRTFEQKWLASDAQPEPASSTHPKIGNTCLVTCYDDNNPEPKIRPRIWYIPEDPNKQMHYTDKHYWFKRRDQIIRPGQQTMSSFEFVMAYRSSPIENIIIKHDHNCRSKDREEKRLYYEREELPELERV